MVAFVVTPYALEWSFRFFAHTTYCCISFKRRKNEGINKEKMIDFLKAERNEM